MGNINSYSNVANKRDKTMREYIRHHNTNCEDTLDWYDDFVDYVQEQYPDLYNDACEYADIKEKEHKLILKSEYEKDKH
jgi:hypothetical protein